jgi:hypothetical protein
MEKNLLVLEELGPNHEGREVEPVDVTGADCQRFKPAFGVCFQDSGYVDATSDDGHWCEVQIFYQTDAVIED